MARFLDDKQLGPAITSLLSGGDVRCAVAFWGDGAKKALFPAKSAAQRARIICDISMGGTNPAELKKLGAPTNSKLQHVKGLHAKVYISDRGAIICSANASNRGIGFLEVAHLTEVGTFHASKSKAYTEISAWFEELSGKAKALGPKALKEAERNWAKRPKGGGHLSGLGTADPASLLHAVVANPSAYRGVGFVFSSGQASPDDVTEAAQLLIALDDERPTKVLSQQKRRQLKAWDHRNLFTGWPDADARAWPKVFICAYQGERGGLSYWLYERIDEVAIERDSWTVFVSKRGDLRRELGLPASLQTMARADARLLERVFDHISPTADRLGDPGHRLCENGDSLVALLGGLRDE